MALMFSACPFWRVPVGAFLTVIRRKHQRPHIQKPAFANDHARLPATYCQPGALPCVFSVILVSFHELQLKAGRATPAFVSSARGTWFCWPRRSSACDFTRLRYFLCFPQHFYSQRACLHAEPALHRLAQQLRSQPCSACNANRPRHAHATIARLTLPLLMYAYACFTGWKGLHDCWSVRQRPRDCCSARSAHPQHQGCVRPTLAWHALHKSFLL